MKKSIIGAIVASGLATVAYIISKNNDNTLHDIMNDKLERENKRGSTNDRFTTILEDVGEHTIKIKHDVPTYHINEEFITMRKDLRHCPSEIIIGKSGTGKKYIIKQEIKAVLKYTDDYVLVIDSTGEYHEFCFNMMCKYGDYRLSVNDLSKYPREIASKVLEDIFTTIYSCQWSNGNRKRMWVFIDNANNFDFEIINSISKSSRPHGVIPTFAIQADYLTTNIHALFIHCKSVIVTRCNENRITDDILRLLGQKKTNIESYWNMWIIDGLIHNLVINSVSR